MTTHIYTGQIQPLPPENQPTGIYKQRVTQTIALDWQGLVGDVQADRRVHGGPDKALHLYPVEHYRVLAQSFAHRQSMLVAGSIGENISAQGLHESNVAIGDVFQWGQAVIQVSEPRSPCWKIDRRYDCPGMARYIAQHILTGWYFRVLQVGSIAPDQDLVQIDRLAKTYFISELLHIWSEHRPSIDPLMDMAQNQALSANWVNKLTTRAQQLKQLQST